MFRFTFQGQFGRIKLQRKAGNATAGKHAPGQNAGTHKTASQQLLPIEPEALNEEFSVSLIEVFAEIFGLFRNKFEEMPWLVNEIAKRIVEVESRNGSKTERQINQLYLSIFCKHFEYKNIEKIISTLQTDTRIQKAIFTVLPATAHSSQKYRPAVASN